ncbi:MAG: hypothetical protein WAW17_16485, partial [Rhodococcus sp. (in: high G+C Gram-positive bacteria)]|uniref:hypothetical protein n=1 Tax=Rhodococcus sp. TaxID=1831 RepID=UPI003BB0919C
PGLMMDQLDFSGTWTGRAQKSAFTRVSAEKDFATRIALVAQQLAETSRKCADELAWARERVLTLVGAAEADGFMTNEDWSVGIQPTVVNSGEMAQLESTAAVWQEKITNAIADLDDSDRAYERTAGDRTADLPTGGEVDGNATPSPGIPGPPRPPSTDSGQAAHGSQPWYARGDDLIFKKTVAEAASAADAVGWTNAAAHLRHYLGNSGDDYTVDPDEVMRDDPTVRLLTDSMVNSEVQRIAAETVASGNYGQPVQFQTEWRDSTFDQETQPDWFYAIGSMENSASGVVTVNPPDVPGGEPRVTVDYQTHVFDRYNWDGSKSTEIAGVTVTDASMGELHTSGLAQEFNLTGSSSVKHFDGALPANGVPIELPNAPDNRDGTRSDPGR